MASRAATSRNPRLHKADGMSRRDIIALAPTTAAAVGVTGVGLSGSFKGNAETAERGDSSDPADGAALTASRKAYYRRARF